MNDRNLINGLVVLAAGLLASSISSFLEHFAVLGTATEFARGLCDGLSMVPFCAAIFILACSKQTAKP